MSDYLVYGVNSLYKNEVEGASELVLAASCQITLYMPCKFTAFINLGEELPNST
jgi:hypothetical protein